MIKVNNLKKNYSEFNLNINLEIPEGRITGIVGKNGAGKSTTIKAILGLIEPDSGFASILGKNSHELSVHDRTMIGVSMAESGFSPYLRISDVNKILKKCYPEYEEPVFLKLCHDMGLPLNKQIKELSTGMKDKLRVIVALTHKAKVLVLDEPTSGLDVEARGEVLDLIREYLIEDESRSVLITSHISSDLENICDDIYLIHKGEVILHEDTDVILGSYGVLKVDEELYSKLDKQYIIKTKKEAYGFSCFTNEKQYYLENYPGITIENGRIDELILMLTGGVK